MTGPDKERRTAPRYRCAAEAELVVPSCGLRFRGRIADLSTGGCFMETPCRLERGTSVEIRMEAEGVPLRVAAHLLACRPNGVGCRFSQLSPRKIQQLQSLIAELRQACPAEPG